MSISPYQNKKQLAEEILDVMNEDFIGTFLKYPNLTARPTAAEFGVGTCQIGGVVYVSDGLEWTNINSTSLSYIPQKAPLIRAPLWAITTAYVLRDIVRHSNGQLMICVAAGTSGGSEPTFSSTALMSGDGTCSWAAMGKESKVNTDGYPVPTIARSGTAPTNSALRSLFTSLDPGKIVAFFGSPFNGGSGYVDGTYTNVPLTGGSGTGALAVKVVVSSGAVTSPLTIDGRGTGTGYIVNEVLSINNAYLGGTGSGVQLTIKTVMNTPIATVSQANIKSNTVQSNQQSLGFLYDDGGNSASNAQAVRVIEFVTDDPTPGINVYSTVTRLFVMVDGYPIEENITATVSATNDYYIIDWGGVRKLRKYTVCMLNSLTLTGINLLASSVLYPPREQIKKGVYFGDSYNSTISSYNPASVGDYLAHDLFRNFGITALRNYAIGGSGYGTGKIISDGNLTSAKYTTLALFENNDLTGYEDAELVVFANGLNDISATVSTVVANAVNCWNRALELFPYATIVIFGPWCENSGPGATTLALDAALKAAFDTWKTRNNVFYHSVCQDSVEGAWVSGTGVWGTTTGTGNSDFYTGADGIHASFPGRSYLVNRMVDSIKSDI